MISSSSLTHNFSSDSSEPSPAHYRYRFCGDVDYSRRSSGMRVSRPHHPMPPPSFESRNAMESRNYNTVKYETTSEGDVAVVQPSFDAEDSKSEGGAPASHKGGRKHSHTRNLSEHFFDATTLSGGPEGESSHPEGEHRYGPPRSGYRAPPPESSPEIGKKHRRVFSGDVTNPREAHRRINSVGKSAPIQRRSYGQERQHQRVDSLGLDVLTAAADVSREELAAAAGAGERARDSRNPWEPPPASRRSPVEMISYDHSARGVPPPPPPPRAPYPTGPPPPGYYSNGLPYPHPPYPPPYGHPAHHHYPHGPPPPPSGYPVQYSRGQDPYHKHPSRQQPKPEMESSGPIMDSYNHKKPTETSAPREGSAMTPPPPLPPSHWRGTTQGSQTYVTTIGVGEGGRTVHSTHYPPPEGPGHAYQDGHHRKTSSVTNWVPPSIYSGNQAETPDHPLKGGHHRATSSSVSFLQCFDIGLDNQDAAFLKNLQASAESPSKPLPSHATNDASTEEAKDGGSKLAPGGTSKRVRRKCTVPDCSNRVVQGGLCISHGAKRKTCKHPGCTKNVKKAGLCSTHGPARKRCDAEGCTKVAVQGGKCIAHGAKKKLCSVENCTKQAILSGMCKKHHDHSRNAKATGDSKAKSTPNENNTDSTATKKANHKPKHTRGLSIFQEISADAVGTLLSGNDETEGSYV